MKIVLVLAFFLFDSVLFYGQTVYGFSISSAEGNQHSLQEYSGKNILVVILPVTRNTYDSLYLKWVDSVAESHKTDLKVIAVPSYEDGYTNTPSYGLDAFYKRNLNGRVLISNGLNTHKTSIAQHSLFAWLTNVTQNMHFDKDVSGAGQMFFVNANGVLHGVFGPDCRFSNKIINYMLH